MIEPNFSESQLQQLVNTEITMSLFSYSGRIYNPIIPSLIEEHNLSWDTGFYFPWLPTPPHPKQRDCNIFIQYKLSKLIEGRRGREYQLWGCPYLRFKMPYNSKDKSSGAYFYDYGQFDNLKKLANQGYNVYYATNNVVYSEDLFRIAESQRLLREIPFLDVSMINRHHRSATFTQRSTYFLLFSEGEKIDIKKWKYMYSQSMKSKGTLLSHDLKFLSNFILNFEKKMDISRKRGFRKDMSRIEDVQHYKEKMILEAMLISAYLRKYLNLYWYRLWLK